MMFPIPEIDETVFETLLINIRKGLGQESKQSKDPFLEVIKRKYPDATHLNSTSISQKIGHFHERLIGSFPGWHHRKNAGVDVFSNDGQYVIEVKNKYNTMNSDSQRSVIEKLATCTKQGKIAILCIINVQDGKVPNFANARANNILVVSGPQMYEMITGRQTAFDEVLKAFEKYI